MPDGTIQRLCREVILYTDLRSGEVLQEWKNPYLNETVKVVHVDNDPFNYMIEDFLPGAAVLRRPQQGSAAAARALHPALVPARSTGPRWRSTSTSPIPAPCSPTSGPGSPPGPIAQVSEFFAHHVRVEDLQNREAHARVDYRGTWNRITPWLPWMLMGQMPGHAQYNCFMGNTDDLEQVCAGRCWTTPRRTTRSTSPPRRSTGRAQPLEPRVLRRAAEAPAGPNKARLAGAGTPPAPGAPRSSAGARSRLNAGAARTLRRRRAAESRLRIRT